MVEAHVSADELVAGRYRLLETVHRETNRVCWSGQDVRTGEPCLLTQIGMPPDQDPDAVRRALARVVRMSHTMRTLRPGRVARVVDAVEEYGTLWTVTEWIDGVPLGVILEREGALAPPVAARVALELLEVLETGHAEGITHGELSPGQVFVREDGPVVVTGYGLAGATLSPRVSAPSYASPEQARDERIGPAADMWALGAILYRMIEGHPLFRDRESPESTLKGVDRLPLRSPVRAGPLTHVLQGLLRRNCRERLSRSAVRQALTRVIAAEAEAAPPGEPADGGSRRSGRGIAAAALAVAVLAAAVVVAVRELPGDDRASAADAPPPASAAASPSATPTAPVPQDPAASPTGSAEASTPPNDPAPTARQPRLATFSSPLGFSVRVPAGWKALQTSEQNGLAYRVVLGAQGDPRTLTVTHSTRVGDDPVAVWRDTVEPGLRREGGYERLALRATTHRGLKAADLEWLTTADGTRRRTLGRGFLLGDGTGYSLRWTAPAQDWEDPANEQTLAAVLRSFRFPEG